MAVKPCKELILIEKKKKTNLKEIAGDDVSNLAAKSDLAS